MLKQRVITAVVLLVGFLAALLWLPQAGWVLLLAAIAGAAGWEWAGLLKQADGVRIGYGLTVAVLTGAAGFACGLANAAPIEAARPLAMAYLLALAFWAVLAPLWLWRRWQLRPLPGLLLGVALLLPAVLALMQLRQWGATAVLLPLSIIWISDIAAYFTGRRFGKTKLAPQISPGKTWEGVAGAVVGVLIYGALLGDFGNGPLPLQLEFAVTTLFLLAMTALGIVGDLFESLLKRQAGIKDSSALLPGHGGVLDRIDALIPALPLVGCFLVWFA